MTEAKKKMTDAIVHRATKRKRKEEEGKRERKRKTESVVDEGRSYFC